MTEPPWEVTVHVALLGAAGYTGRLIAEELEAAGVGFTPAGRDGERLSLLAAGLGRAADPFVVDASDPERLGSLAAGHDVLVNAAGPFGSGAAAVVEACLGNGCRYVDISAEQGFQRQLIDRYAARAESAGLTIAPAAGLQSVPGDALAVIAARAVGEPSQVHVAYYVPGATGMFRRLSAGSIRTMAAVAGDPVVAVVGGQRVEERLGEARRLAWFPKPVGPHHAAGSPGLESLTMPRRWPDLQIVRSYVAIPSWQAEVAQFLGTAAAWQPVQNLLHRVTDGRRGGPAERLRTQTRWACVAEAAGTGGLARAWAYGYDIYGFTAASCVLVAGRVMDDATPRGVVGPGDLSATDLLDDLADRGRLQWALATPA